MQELLAKTNSELKIILNELVDRVHPLFGKKLKKVILFGSYARGDYDAESDIDIMLMLNEEEAALKEYYKKITDITVDLDLKYEPHLDTLFLAMPISWKGTLQQYAGRLHRLFENKKEAQIYDYVDIHYYRSQSYFA